MPFDFPNSPVTGDVYAPSGGPAYQYDGEKWKGGQPSGPVTEQFFDLAGKASVDITVPTWATGMIMDGCVYAGVAITSSPILQYSLDGTTFVGGSSYNFGGPWHASSGASPGTYASFAQTAAAGFMLSVSTDNVTVPVLFTAQLNLVAAGSEGFVCRSVGTTYQNAVPTGSRHVSMLTYAVATGRIKALRFISGPASINSSWLRIQWLGDAAQVPISNAIADAPSDGKTYGRLNGAWTQTLPITGGTLTGALTAQALFPASIAIGHGNAIGVVNNVAGMSHDAGNGMVLENGGGSLHVNKIGSNGASVVFYHAGTACGSITVANTTSTAYNTTSDGRLKEDRKSFDAGPLIDALEVFDFKWTTSEARGHGVIAQDAVEVFPEAIFHDEENDSWGADYSKFVPLLLQEMKALRARVAELESR